VRAALPPVQKVVVQPEDSLIEANGHCIEKYHDDLQDAGHEQKKAEAGDRRQEHKKNGYSNCDIAEHIVDDCCLIHGNSPQPAQ